MLHNSDKFTSEIKLIFKKNTVEHRYNEHLGTGEKCSDKTYPWSF